MAGANRYHCLPAVRSDAHSPPAQTTDLNPRLIAGLPVISSNLSLRPFTIAGHRQPMAGWFLRYIWMEADRPWKTPTPTQSSTSLLSCSFIRRLPLPRRLLPSFLPSNCGAPALARVSGRFDEEW